MTDNISQRDAFFNKLYDLAKENRDIILISADMGAPSLDKFRKDLSSQFINVGIAEQGMVTLASGLALSGKKVFIYAIMPFVTLRPYEMLKVCLSLMNIPVTAVGVGSGLSYDDSGPTHHSSEDIAIMRALPNMTVLDSSDSVMSARFAEISCELTGPNYVRLDRQILPPIHGQDISFAAGLASLRVGEDVCIVSSGNMVHRALEVSDKLKERAVKAGVVDLYRLKPVNEKQLVKNIKQSASVVTLEENFYNGGIGSIVAEVMVDNGLTVPVKRIALDDKYCYAYGGRDNLQSLYGLDAESVTKTILEWLPVTAGKKAGK